MTRMIRRMAFAVVIVGAVASGLVASGAVQSALGHGNPTTPPAHHHH